LTTKHAPIAAYARGRIEKSLSVFVPMVREQKSLIKKPEK
jgi:hypothetical protein